MKRAILSRLPFRSLSFLASLFVIIALAAAACTQDNTPPMGSLDAPATLATVSGTVQVLGWALDKETPTASLAFTLLIDDSPVTAPLSRFGRSDVCAAFPEGTYPGSCRSGIRFEWNTAGLSGSHAVAVKVTDAGGLSKVLGPRKVTVNAPRSTLPTAGRGFSTIRQDWTVAKWRPVESQRLIDAHHDPKNWLMYARTYDSQRFSPLAQIDTANVKHLGLQWKYPTGIEGIHVATPIVQDGVLYTTSVWNKLYALNAQTGGLLWAVEATSPSDIAQFVSASPANRGVAVFGSRVYWATLDARLVALKANSGAVLWDRAVEDYRKGYTMTLAPLIIDGSVIVGVAGGELGVRGFLAAFDARTGKQRWKTYTIPAPGQPGSETWQLPGSWETGGGAPWLTGSYDPSLNLLYWATGNPAPVYDGMVRPGANLYTNSMLALDPKTGSVRWFYQFTPHDVWDFDGVDTPILIDDVRLADGRVVRKALAQANRNGHFYLLDRINGRLIHVQPFEKVEEIQVDPRSGHVTPKRMATYEHPADACSTFKPWFPAAYSPLSGYMYVPLVERCVRYTSHRQAYKQGQAYYGGTSGPIRPSSGSIVAIDVSSGRTVWRHHMGFPAAGSLATGGGLVFSSGVRFVALDARTGNVLWTSRPALRATAGPISYSVKGKQYIAVVASGLADPNSIVGDGPSGDQRSSESVQPGGIVLAFALPEGIPGK